MTSFRQTTRRLLFPTLVFLLLSGCKDSAQSSSSPSPGPNTKAPAGDEFVAAGNPFPSLELIDLEGKERSLSEFKGKTILLNFWATWCRPCVAEMPALERLHQSLKDKGLVVVAVSVDGAKDRTKVTDFIKQRALTFPVLSDIDFKSATKLGISGFPETFFIDGQGKAVPLTDPVAKKPLVRVISDRPWDSPQYVAAVEELLSRAR